MGGSQYQAKMLLESLVEDGHEVTYLARSTSPDFEPKGYQIVTLKGHGRSRVFDSKDLYSQLKMLNPDVIYQRVGCAYTGVCAYYSRRHDARMIWHLASDMDVGQSIPRSRNPLNQLEWKMVDYGRKHASVIVAQTQDQAALLLNTYGRNVNAVIPNFQPVPEVFDHQTSKVGTSILWIGNLKPIKQPDIFVQLANDLRDVPNLSFRMIGRPYPDKSKQLAIEEKMSAIPNLEYVGGLPLEQVNEVLRETHLLINTSTVEGFSNTFIQAWMRGVPVVSLRVNPDNVLSNENLGRTAGNRYESLKALTLDLVEDPNTRQRLSDNVRDYALKNHSMQNISQLKKVMLD